MNIMFLSHIVKQCLRKGCSGEEDHILKGIRQLQFEITNDCNLNCRICWRTLNEKKDHSYRLSFKQFACAVDTILTVCDIKEINTQGLGEPLLCPDALDIFSYIKSKNITLWFVTNGTLIDELMARKFVEIGVDKIRFSIDTVDSAMYAQIKQGSALENVLNNITRINVYKKEIGSQIPVLSINSVISKSTYDGIDALIEMAAQFAIREVTLIPLVNFSKGMAMGNQQVDFYSDEFQERYNSLSARAHKKGIDLNLGISLETKETKFCHYGFYIDVKGMVHPCCNISQLTFGNIYTQHIDHIMKKYLDFRKWLDHREMSCKDCNRFVDKRN